MATMDLTTTGWYDNPSDITSIRVLLTATDESKRFTDMFQWGGFIGAVADHPNSIFTSIDDFISYAVTTYSAGMIDYYDSIFLTSGTTLGSVRKNVYLGTVDYVTPTARNAISVTGAGSYNSSTGVITISAGSAPTTSSLSLSFVGTGATGTQISSTKASTAKINVNLSATASIAGGATSNVTFKKCATNSATESDWITALPTIAEIGQSYSLAIALQGVQTDKRQLSIDVPAGWYVKAQNSGTGTHSESITGGEKTIYG